MNRLSARGTALICASPSAGSYRRGSSPHRADSKSITGVLAGAVSMGWGRLNRPLLVLESASAVTDLDLISDLRSIPDARMRRGVRFQAWYLLLLAVL